MSENVGVSTSPNPKGLHGLYRKNFTFLHEPCVAAVTPQRVFFSYQEVRNALHFVLTTTNSFGQKN
jgi:hypothetical protein